MPKFASSLTSYTSILEELLTELTLTPQDSERFWRFWQDEGDNRDIWVALAELLSLSPSELLTRMAKDYRAPAVRPEIGAIQEDVLEHFFRVGMDAERLNGWIPVQKVGIGLVFLHFLPNAPKPEFDRYLCSYVFCNARDYVHLKERWESLNLSALRASYTTHTFWEAGTEISPANLKDALLADPQMERPQETQLQAVPVDPESGFSQFLGRLPEPYESWNACKEGELSDALGMFNLSLEVVFCLDPTVLKFANPELNFDPFKSNDLEWVSKYKVLPLHVVDNYVLIGSPYADKSEVQQDVSTKLTGWNCLFARITPKAYTQLASVWSVTKPQSLSTSTASDDAQPIIPFEGELTIGVDQAEAAKDNTWVISFVGNVIGQAIELGASDIHIEPIGDSFRVRYRLDGRLQQINDAFPSSYVPYVINRIKNMSEMDLSEKRKGQDGRFKVSYNGRTIDIRVATSPVENGGMLEDANETATLRILDPFNYPSSLDAIVEDREQRQRVRDAAYSPSGIIIVTGPTGSGKSTTLYTLISELNSDERNIITLEDPVERRIIGVNQTSIKKPNTFADSLRIALRRDPDVILVGEVRDAETAELIVKASRTGHQVFTSLHTDNSIGASSRLKGLGVGSSELADSLSLITGQRLIRKICRSCRSKRDLSRKETEWFQDYKVHSELVDSGMVYESTGCSFCNGTGYKGRFAIMEVLPISEEIKAYLDSAERFNAYELYKIAIEAGFEPLFYHALQEIAKGTTDFKEVVARVPESKATLYSRSKMNGD